jgi:hypothetical protein
MNNYITIGLEFYFKGQKHTPSMVVDLDPYIQTKNSLDSLYPMLANSNNIDLYSYEYEIMLTEDLIFSDATGLAASFLEDGKFDFPAFERALHDESLTEVLAKIASNHLSIENLSSHPDLKAALLEAYRLGQKSSC